jgi:cell pole-organizing protein PopZ
MEDILASIRRILNEDEAAAPPNASPPSPASRPPPADEPLDLTREMLVGGPPAPAQVSPPAPPAPTPPAVPAPAASPPPQPSVEPPAPATPAPTPVADGLLAPAAAAAASASVGSLLRAVAAERGSAVRSGGPTIEDLVREELRPLLKEWLDQHLPAVVERLVRAEIERVVGRALS